MRRWTAIVCFTMTACAYTQPVPKGEGTPSSASKERLKSESMEAYFGRLESKAQYASSHPRNERANREAVEMTRQALRLTEYSKEASYADASMLVSQVSQSVANLASLGTSCATDIEVAQMYIAAGMDGPAHAKLDGAMTQCGSPSALRVASHVYKRLNRCDELQPHAARIWPNAGSDEQISVLDSVAICSTAVNLRPNLLAFAPPSVVGDYFHLLDERARARQRDQCLGSCWSGYDSCSYGCWGGQCGCEQVRSLCEASCR